MNSFRHLHQPTGRTINHNGKDYLFFGGTAYLGLLVNPAYQALVYEGVKKYGLNNGTSRSNNVQLGIYDDAEEVLSKRFGFETSALFSSGYLAAQATVSMLTRRGEVIYAPHTHQALWLRDQPLVRTSNFEEWIAEIVIRINESNTKNFVVIANGIDNLSPSLYDFSALINVNSSKHVTLILDDSHGLGIVHKNAISTTLLPILSNNIDVVVVASLAKGLGTDAGLVLGSRGSIAEIKKSPIFMGASPSSPAFVYALINGAQIYEEAYERLHANIIYFREQIKQIKGLQYVDRFPVFTSHNSNLYRYLCNKKMLISSFPYPLPNSPLLNRLVISSLHQEDDLLTLAEVLQDNE